MSPSDELTEQNVRSIVREEFAGAARTLLGTVVWTLLSAFSIVVGLQLVQIGLFTASLAATGGFVFTGAVVTGASLYLLYLIHWVQPSPAGGST